MSNCKLFFRKSWYCWEACKTTGISMVTRASCQQLQNIPPTGWRFSAKIEENNKWTSDDRRSDIFFNLTSFLQFFSQHPLEESVLEHLSLTKCKMPHWCQENKAQFKEALHIIPSEFLLSARSTSLHKNDKAQDYAWSNQGESWRVQTPSELRHFLLDYSPLLTSERKRREERVSVKGEQDPLGCVVLSHER